MDDFQVKNLTADKEKNLKILWFKSHSDLKAMLGEQAFKSWLAQLNLVSLEKKVLYLSLPSNFLCDWVIPHYGNKIETVCKKYFHDISKIKISVNENSKLFLSEGLEDFKALSKNMIADSNPSPIDPRFNFNNFVVGKSNEFAFAAAKRVAESDKVKSRINW